MRSSFSIHFLACKKCNAEWCWDCKRSWSDHDETTGGFFRCKFFDPTQDYEKNEEDDEDDEDDEVNGENNEEKETEETKQRSTLERFTRCLRRYNAHEQEGKYSKRRERASRNGSTVVDISIPPPSFKPVSLPLSRFPLF